MPPTPKNVHTAKNFDTARRAREQETRDERALVLGGETFYAKATVRPEVLARWNDITEDMPMDDILSITDETIIALLENVDDTPTRYRAVRQNEEDPIGFQDLLELAKWLVEVQTGRPIESPSDSSGSPGTTKNGTGSTDDSSSPATQPEPVAST